MDKKANVNQLENYLRTLILEELRKREIELKESDAQQIVSQIICEIDKFTSDRVKQHFIEIADFVKEKFREVE